MKRKPKILCIDIENAPNLYANLGAMLCVGYKELDKREVKCVSAWDFPNWKKDIFDDRAICKFISKEFADADGFIYHYGQRHDLPYINSRLTLHGFPPLPKVASIDTWRVARDNLKLRSNRLKSIAEFFGVATKQHVGWQLWLDVMNKKPSACKKMTEYCKQDVRALEAVYLKLLPFTRCVPNYNLFTTEEKPICHNCGSLRIGSQGWVATKTMRYRRYRCRDCHSTGRYDNHGRKPRTV
jgi:DNA polymerase elongation subunit (family B)